MPDDEGFRDAADVSRALQRDLEQIAAGTKSWGRWTYDAHAGYLVLDRGDVAAYEIPLNTCGTETDRLNWIAQLAEKSWPSDVIGDFVRALNETYGLRQNDALAAIRPARRRD